MSEPQVMAVASDALFGVWMPIETAPKDGTEILGKFQNSHAVVRWQNGGFELSAFDAGAGWEPDEWMSIPPPNPTVDPRPTGKGEKQ